MSKIKAFPLPVRFVPHPTPEKEEDESMPQWDGQNVTWSMNYPVTGPAANFLTRQVSLPTDEFTDYIPVAGEGNNRGGSLGKPNYTPSTYKRSEEQYEMWRKTQPPYRR